MVLETDNICYFNDIKSLNSKYDNMGLLGSLLPRCETLCLFPERLPEGVGVQASPYHPSGPQGGDHQGVQQHAWGHGDQGCLWDKAVKDR